MPTTLAVLGDGAWGTAVAILLARNADHRVRLWSARHENGELLRTRQWARLHEFLGERDLLLTPTTATPPFPIERTQNKRSFLTYAFSVMGLPAISIPCGFTKEKLPIGMQLMGREFDESTLLSVAAAYEGKTTHHLAQPPL